MAASIGAGAAVVGVGAQLLGGNQGNQGQATTQASTPNVPSWMLPYLQQNAAAANSLASKPYQPYTGTQVQPLTDMQNQAGTMSQSLANNGAAVSGMNAANAVQTNVANQGQNGLNPSTIANYMNPYTSSVIDATNLRAQQQEQLQQNQLQAQQGATGAFGGSRASLAQGQLQSNFAQQQSQNNATMFQNNFTNAENMGMQGLGQANTAAQGMMQSTAGAQTAQLQNIGALQTAGGLQQTTGQNQLNAQYQDYLTAQAYPYQQLANSQNILNPIASLTTGTNATGFTQQTGSPGLLQTALGSAAAGASIGNAIGNSNAFGFLNSAPSYNQIYGQQDTTGLGLGYSQQASALNAAPIGTESMTPGEFSAFSNAGFATGGMVPHSRYAEGGQVSQPSLSDHINHFIDQYAQHFSSGGLIKADKTDLPGVPTKYGYSQEQMPYTDQKPKYLIPAYAKGGQIPLTQGLSDASVPGIKRERQHWGKPYVPQTKNSSGYLRPEIKNALATGGIVGAKFSNGGLTAHYDEGGPVDPLAISSGAIFADMATQQAPAESTQQPSLVDAMLNTARNSLINPAVTDGIGNLANSLPGASNPAPQASAPSLAQAPRPDAIPNPGSKPTAADMGNWGFDSGNADTSAAGDKVIQYVHDHPYSSAAMALTAGDYAGAKLAYEGIAGAGGALATGAGALATGAKAVGRYAADNSGNVIAGLAAASPALSKGYDDVKAKIGSIWGAFGLPTSKAGEPITAKDDPSKAWQNAVADPEHKSAVAAGQKEYDAIGAAQSQGIPTPTQAVVTSSTPQQAKDSTTINESDSPEEKYQKYQTMMMDRILKGPGGPDSKVNLPLLSMGAAILGNRSNSLAGALGAGGEAYTKTAQTQSAQNMELMQKMMMAHYYEGRNDIQQKRLDQNAPLVQAKIQKLEQRSTSDPVRQEYDKALNAQIAQGVPIDQAKADAALAAEPMPGQASAPASGGPAIGSIQQGHRFNGGDPSNAANWTPVQ